MNEVSLELGMSFIDQCTNAKFCVLTENPPSETSTLLNIECGNITTRKNRKLLNGKNVFVKTVLVSKVIHVELMAYT